MYESTQNEVKRKMIATGACNAVPKSPRAIRVRRKSLRDAQLHRREFARSSWGVSCRSCGDGALPRPVGRSPAACDCPEPPRLSAPSI